MENDAPAPVLESDSADGYFVGAPSVLLIEGRYVMYFEVNNGATSDEPRARTAALGARRRARSGSGFRQPAIHSPAAVVDPATAVCAYTTLWAMAWLCEPCSPTIRRESCFQRSGDRLF
jgi:hypothetical protein